jgi:hypothetical protein
MEDGMKVKVSERALIQRISRRLKKECKVLRKDRRVNSVDCLGYYIVNERNHIVDGYIDLVKLAEELGVIRPFEELDLK